MLKRVVQLSFLFIGGTLGVLFLPQLFTLFSFTSTPLINNPYVSAILGAIIFYLLNIFLTSPVVNFIKWMEDRLLKAPIFDLLFGTIGLIVGLSVAFLISFWLGNIEIPVISSVLPTFYLLFSDILVSKSGLSSEMKLFKQYNLRKLLVKRKKRLKKQQLECMEICINCSTRVLLLMGGLLIFQQLDFSKGFLSSRNLY